MNYGFEENYWQLLPIESEVADGDVLWADKIGGKMIGRSFCGVHPTRDEATAAAKRVLAEHLSHAYEGLARVTRKLAALK